MARLARDIMTIDPACCTPSMTLDDVAKMMVQNDCGEIPIVDTANRPIGVVTDSISSSRNAIRVIGTERTPGPGQSHRT